MLRDAGASHLTCVAYAAETATRWSSGLLQLISVIVNNLCHSLTKAKNPKLKEMPNELDRRELKEAIHIAAVLEPLRLAMKCHDML